VSDLGGIRLVLDQGVPRDAAEILRDAGFDCVHVGELGLSQAADLENHRTNAAAGSDRGYPGCGLPHDSGGYLGQHTLSDTDTHTGTWRIEGRGYCQDAHWPLLGRIAAGCLITVKPNRTTCHVLPVAGIG
jgi:hypothetical protein